MDASVARLIYKAISLYYGQPALLLQGEPSSQAVWNGRESFQPSHRRPATTEGDTCFVLENPRSRTSALITLNTPTSARFLKKTEAFVPPRLLANRRPQASRAVFCIDGR